MSLVLTCHDKDEISIGPHVLTVGPIIRPDAFYVRVDQGQLEYVTSNDWVTVAKGVQVRSTIPKQYSTSRVRLAFNAPDFYIHKIKESTHDET